MKTSLSTALLSTALLSTAFLSTGAQALTQKVKLDMNGAHFRGQEKIALKRMIRRQFGTGLTQGFSLKKVEIQAKSKQGSGRATLVVGYNQSSPVTIPGTPENFESDYSGFTNLTLNAPYSYRGDRQGKMQILLNGNIKVDEIKLTLKKSLAYDYSNISMLGFRQVAEFKAQKVVGSTKTIRPNGRVSGIALVGTKGKVRITEVEVTYMDGQTVILDELNGKLKKGRTKGFALRGQLQRPIRKIKVSATSTNLFGSRGRLAVRLGNRI